MRTFHYISARPGSGKTHYAINKLAARFLKFGTNVLFVVPTIVLCDQIARDSNGQIKAIHQDNSENVISTIQNYFNTSQKSVGLVITDASFHAIAWRIVAKGWVLIKDEASEPLKIEKFNCTDSQSLLDKWMKFEPIVSTKGHRQLLKAVSFSEDAPVTSTADDAILGNIHRIKELSRNKHVEILIDDTRSQDQSSHVTFSYFYKPSMYEGFDHSYFMGANFEHTFLYHQWKHAGVEWKNSTPAAIKDKNFNTSRVRLHYWSENGIWSSSRRSGKEELGSYIKWIKSKLPDNDYIYAVNAKEENSPEVKQLNGEKIPQTSHGLNLWKNFTKFVSIGSYLISDHLEPFYQQYGTSTTDSFMLRNIQMIFQQITRTDLRNHDSNKQIDIYLPTLSEALALSMYMPDALIIDMNKKFNGHSSGINGKLRNSWKTQSDAIASDFNVRSPNYSIGKNTKEIFASCMDGAELLSLSLGRSNRLVVEKTPPHIILAPPFSTTKQQRNVQNKWRTNKRIHPLVAYLKYCADISTIGVSPETIKLLKANELKFFVTGIFTSGARFRKTSLIGNNDVIAFDFDDSDLSTSDISRIFQNFEYLKYTTISHDPSSGKNRFRVVLPCSRTMSLDEHQKIMKYFLSKIRSYAKEVRLESGIDEKCIGAERKFYCPHIEAKIDHIYREKEVLDIDIILRQIPRDSLVKIPILEDIEIQRTMEQQSNGDCIPPIIIDKINDMSQGNRSTPAVQIGGIISKMNLSDDVEEEIFSLMKIKGVSNVALKKAREYASQPNKYFRR